METKICKKCGHEKSLTEYYKVIKSVDGYNTRCKLCIREQQNNYYINNPEIFKEKRDGYYKNNKEKFVEYHKDNREKILEQQKQYRENNSDKIAKTKKEYRGNNQDKIKEYREKYYQENKEAILKKNREWNKKHSHIVAWRSVLKSQLRRFGKKKEGKTIDLLGYSAIELKEHIESLFTEGMTWDNHGEWEIDHKLPVTSFDENTPSSIVNALSNLQPLWRNENRSKYNKF